MSSRATSVKLLLWPLFWGLVDCNFDLFTDQNWGKDEDTRIFYVRDGEVNHYAVMTFQGQVIPPWVDSLLLWWRADSPLVTYSIHVSHSPSAAMRRRPALNISATGTVPVRQEAFGVRLICTGVAQGEVEFFVQINFSTASDSETVNLRRLKACSVSTSSSTPSRELTEKKEKKKKSDPSWTVALGAAAGAFALMAVLLTVMYVTRKRRIPLLAPSPIANLRLNAPMIASMTATTSCPQQRQRRRRNYFNTGADLPRFLPYHQQQPLLTPGSYATLASFINVPPDLPRRYLSDSGRWGLGGAASSGHHYGSYHSSSVWSSQTMTSTMARLEHPQQNALVMENGVLKLCPSNNKNSNSEPRLNNTLKEEEQQQQQQQQLQLASCDSFFVSDLFNTQQELDSAQIYPHLMPQNFLKAQRSLTARAGVPRSTSGGSVLV